MASPWLNSGGARFRWLGEAQTPVRQEPTAPAADGLSTPKLRARPNSLAVLLPLLLSFALVCFSFLPTPAALEKQKEWAEVGLTMYGNGRAQAKPKKRGIG